METNMRPAILSFTMVLSLAVVAAVLWHFDAEGMHLTPRTDHLHWHLPAPLIDVWVVMSPGFR